MIPQTTPFPATLTRSVTNLRAALAGWSQLTENAKARVLAALPADGIELLDKDFVTYAHAHQLPPERANRGDPWSTWLMLGGRGAGKTRAGAEWVRSVALADGGAGSR